MNRDELLAHHDEICQMCKDIMVRKNHDYAGSGGDNPFANFTRTEDMGICSAEQGFLVRMTDKMSRLSTFAQCGELKVENESYQDAILDIINYCILLSGYLKQKTEDIPTGPKLTFIQEEITSNLSGTAKTT